MNGKKLQSGDEENTSFVPLNVGLVHAKAGFEQHVDRGGISAGHYRFPHKGKDEIPQQSLAERLRAKH